MALRYKIRNAVFAVLDASDTVMGRKGPLMPPRRLMNVGSNSMFRNDFTAIGDKLLGNLVDFGGLRADDRVLDVGCGVGRLAIAMTRYLTTGSYDGFDIVKESIDHCERAITPRHPNFRFKHADIYNSNYNRQGTIQPRDFRFPYSDGAFTFVLLTSVFTHMQRAEVEQYLAEISRVLAPGGQVFATYFLLNPASMAAMEAGTSRQAFAYPADKGRVEIQHDPDAAIAFEETYLTGLYAATAFRIAKVQHGSWSGQNSDAGYQDIVVAVKG